MNIILLVTAFLLKSGVRTFLTEYVAEKGLDFVLKKIRERIKSSSETLEEELLFALNGALQNTCNHFAWEYDDQAILATFVIKYTEEWELLSAMTITDDQAIKNLLTAAIGQDISNEVFEYWCNCLYVQISNPEYQHLYNYVCLKKLLSVHDTVENIAFGNTTENKEDFIFTHNADIRPVTYFTGREKEIDKLKKSVEKGESVLLSGMGGIGKTHVCRKLFREYVNSYQKGEGCFFSHIGYVEYVGDMENSLKRCLKHNRAIKFDSEAAWDKLEQIAADKRTLLIIDNIDKQLREDVGLERLNSLPCVMIVTTRFNSLNDTLVTQKVSGLSIAECKALYEKIRFYNSNKKIPTVENDDINFIIENLICRHTITIVYLAHLARVKVWSVSRLRDELERNGFKLQFSKNGEVINIQESYEILYDLSVLSDAERNVLEAFSVFPYLSLGVEECSKWLMKDAEKFAGYDEDILSVLYDKGWLQFGIEQESYSLHPVFAQFIFGKCIPKAKEHSELVKVLFNRLVIERNDNESFFDLIDYQIYVLFAETMLTKLTDWDAKEKLDFMTEIARSLYCIGTHKKLFGMYHLLVDSALETEKTEIDNDKENDLKAIKKMIQEKEALHIMDRNDHYVKAYDDWSEFERAEKLFRESIELKAEMSGSDCSGVWEIKGELAANCEVQEKYDEAEKIYLDVVSSIENKCGEYSGRDWYKKLIKLYENRKKYKEAEHFYDKYYDSLHHETAGKSIEEILRNGINEIDLFFRTQQYGMCFIYSKKMFELASRSDDIDEKLWMECYSRISRHYFDLYREGTKRDFEKWLIDLVGKNLSADC